MRLLVTGGRHVPISDKNRIRWVLDYLHSTFMITCIITGGCPHPRKKPNKPQESFSTDKVAEEWAVENNIAVESYPVDHSIDGPWPAAGPKRNKRMVQTAKPDHGLVGVGGRGTDSCARELRLAKVYFWDLRDPRYVSEDSR